MSASASSVDALLFDLGGVLIDVDFGRAVAAWARSAGKPLEELRRRPLLHLSSAFQAHERGEIRDAVYFAALRELFGLALSDEAIASGWNAIIGEPVPGMATLVRDLAARLPLYVFSNTNAAHIEYFKPRHRELLAPFREVICSCEIGCRKPEREAFEKVAARIGAPPGRIGFFDDNPENVASARALGMQAFHVGSLEDVRTGLGRLGLLP